MRLRDERLRGVSVARWSSAIAVVAVLCAVGVSAVGIAAEPNPPAPTGAAPATPAAPPRVAAPVARPASPGAPQPLTATATPTGDQPKAECVEPIFTFPEVWAGDPVEHAWVIKNTGKAVLNILNVQSTCGCTVPQNYDREIAPGAEGKIAVRFNTRGYRGEVNKAIHVKTNDPAAAQITLQLKGKVNPRLMLDPANGAQFGRVTPQTPFPLTRVVKITNNTDKPFKLEPSPPVTNTCYQVTIKETVPGKVAEATIEVVKEKMIENNNFASLMIRTGWTEEPEFPIPAGLINPPIIQVNAPSLAVATPVTAAFHREVVLTNNGAQPIKVTEVTANDPGISVQAKETRLPAQQAAGVPATQPATVQSWVIVVDIPVGWDPPPPPVVAGAPPRPANFEIVAKTDLPEKPEVKINLMTFPQRANASQLVGALAPQIALMDSADRPAQIGGATGHVTVTAFYATWCGYCKKMLPVLQQMAEEYASKGVNFNIVSTDTIPAADVAKVMKDLNLTMPYMLDSKRLASLKYGAVKVPTIFTIGKNGVIEAVNQGWPVGFEQTLKAQIDALLADKDRRAFPVIAKATPPAPTTPMPNTAAPVSTTPLLILDTLSQDMGAFKPGSTGKFNLHVRNAGGQPLNLTNVTPSAGLTLDPSSPKVIQPNAPTALTLQFTAPKEPGEFKHELTIESNDPAKPKVTVALKGKVRELIEVDPPTGLDFGRRPVTFEMPRMATLTWNGDGAVKFLAITCNSPKFQATLRPIQQGPNYMVLVKAQPPFDLGETTAELEIKTDCQEKPVIKIPIKLVQPERIEVVPPVANVTKSARLQEATVAITNNGGDSLHILGVDVANPKIRTQFYPEVDGLSYRLRVMLLPGYTPAADGDKVIIRTGDNQYSKLEIPIKLADTATPAAGISQLPPARP